MSLSDLIAVYFGSTYPIQYFLEFISHVYSMISLKLIMAQVMWWIYLKEKYLSYHVSYRSY